jgi:hypothetical protein
MRIPNAIVFVIWILRFVAVTPYTLVDRYKTLLEFMHPETKSKNKVQGFSSRSIFIECLSFSSLLQNNKSWEIWNTCFAFFFPHNFSTWPFIPRRGNKLQVFEMKVNLIKKKQYNPSGEEYTFHGEEPCYLCCLLYCFVYERNNVRMGMYGVRRGNTKSCTQI